MANKWQSIMSAIKTRMQGILVTGGYNTNLGSHILTGRPRQIGADGSVGASVVDPAECPCMVLRDPMNEPRPALVDGGLEHRLSVEMEIRYEGGTDTDEDLRKSAADAYKAIGVDETWGGLAVQTEPGPIEQVILQGEKIIGAALVRVVVIYQTPDWET